MINNFNIDSIDYIVRYVIYFILIIGSWLIAFPLIKPILKKKQKFSRIKTTKEKKGWVIKHIEKILIIAFNSSTNFSVYTFFLIVVLLFMFSFIFLSSIGQNLYVRIVISVFISSIPYLLLRIRLYSIQVESSYEGDELIGELSSQYKINYFNMQEAIIKTIPKLKKSPYTSKALFRLARQLPQYRTTEELQEFVEVFTFSIGTEWAILLGNNILISLLSDEIVTEAMDDIFYDLKDLNSINEKNKQQNHESFTMILFIVPLTYVASVLFMFKFLTFDLSKFIDYQFKNELGFRFFVLTFMFMIINFMVFLIIKKPKNDF